MPRFIIKHPDPWNLYSEIPDPDTLPVWQPKPTGYEVMTDEELAAWADQERDNGWIPAPVTRYQMRRALNHVGLRQAIEAAVAASDIDVQDAWEAASEFAFDHPLMQSFAAAIGQTRQQMESLFALAGSYK